MKFWESVKAWLMYGCDGKKDAKERKELQRVQNLRSLVIVEKVKTDWNAERCIEFDKKFSALQTTLINMIHEHPLSARIRGEWWCNLNRRFPDEVRDFISMLPHLTIKDDFLPTIGDAQHLGAELHFDDKRMNIESYESANSLVERMLLRYASSQLYLAWHANYEQEQLGLSLDNFLAMSGISWSGKNVFYCQFGDVERAKLLSWPWIPNVGQTKDGKLMAEYLTIKPYRTSGIILHRVMFDSSEPFGICDVVVDQIPFINRVCF